MKHCWPTTPNTVGCYMLRVSAYPVAGCCALLEVVAQGLKLVKLLSQQLPAFLLWLRKRSATMLNPCAQVYYWSHACTLHMVYKVLCVVSFPQFTAGPNNVGSCCIHLHTTANTDATTPNILGPTTLAVVLFICSSLKKGLLILSYPITIKTKFAIEFVTLKNVKIWKL